MRAQLSGATAGSCHFLLYSTACGVGSWCALRPRRFCLALDVEETPTHGAICV